MAVLSESSALPSESRENARALAASLSARGSLPVSGGADNHVMMVTVGARGNLAPGCREAPGRGRHHRQQEHDRVRRALADGRAGFRIETPAVTPRGIGLAEMEVTGKAIARTLDALDSATVLQGVRRTIAELCAGFPVPA